jgi:hypothetical protein
MSNIILLLTTRRQHTTAPHSPVPLEQVILAEFPAKSPLLGSSPNTPHLRLVDLPWSAPSASCGAEALGTLAYGGSG